MYETYEHFTNDLLGLCGYTGYGVTQDGAALCESCMHEERELIQSAIAERNDPEWEILHVAIHWEGEPLHCDHCSGIIEPSYE